MEEAFFWFEVEVVKLGNFEDILDCASMIVHICTGGDSNVVHVDLDGCAKGFMFEDDVVINVVHHGLESRWGIGKSEVHDCRFKEPVSGFKCRFLLVSFANADVVVPPLDVKLRVDMCVTEIADKICDQGKGILVANGDGVDFAVVLYQSQFAVFLANKEE